MLTPRTFPRYDISQYEFQLLGENNAILKETIPLMASLGGISFESKNEEEIKDLQKIMVQYKHYHFNLTFNQIWFSKVEVNTFRAGYEILFQDNTEYKKWLLFIKSLHRLRTNS